VSDWISEAVERIGLTHRHTEEDSWYCCSQCRAGEVDGWCCLDESRAGKPCDCGHEARLERVRAELLAAERRGRVAGLREAAEISTPRARLADSLWSDNTNRCGDAIRAAADKLERDG
jgi:hypothetical protein